MALHHFWHLEVLEKIYIVYIITLLLRECIFISSYHGCKKLSLKRLLDSYFKMAVEAVLARTAQSVPRFPRCTVSVQAPEKGKQ